MNINWFLVHLCLVSVLLPAVISTAQPVIKVAAGMQHSLFLKENGSLWTMGYNQFGQLGDGSNYSVNLPKQIVASNVVAVAGGDYHSLFLKDDGSLWAMGNNRYGQLGDGTYTTVYPYGTNQPEQIVASNVTAIAAGEGFSLFLKNDGSLWAMGNNSVGQLGNGTYSNETTQPEQIVSSNVTAIATGGGRSMFLKNDGSLWAMGGNSYGEFGNGPNYGTNQPVQILASNVTAVAAGEYHTLLLKSDGSLWAMGSNLFGQLGDGSNNDTNFPEMIVSNNVTTIAAGWSHSLFLKSDGSLWAMGNNVDGELGDGSYTSPGTNRPEQIVASGVTAIAAGMVHSLFVKDDGSLWSMGGNFMGQLGDDTIAGPPNFSTNRPAQILGAYNHIQTKLSSSGKMQLSFVGIAEENYALEHSFSLSPPSWISQITNSANLIGKLMFTNSPDDQTNNFWRIRSVP